MKTHMSRFVRKKIEVVGTVIKFVSVNMMDNFFFKKVASKMFLGYKNLLRNITIFHSSMMMRLKDLFIAGCGYGVSLKVPRMFVSLFAFSSRNVSFFKRTRIRFHNALGSFVPSRFTFLGSAITRVRTILFNSIVFSSTRKFFTALLTYMCFHGGSISRNVLFVNGTNWTDIQ